MSESKTKKTLRNIIFNFLFKLSDIILAFILRTVFILTLDTVYLGINGLFTNILTVLSLMELGVGSAIVFSLYKPLAEHNHEKVAALMQLYKKVYVTIGIAIMVIGFLITPLLDYIINLPDQIENIRIIYWLTIANTSMSYFLSYRRSLLVADQRADINSLNLMLFKFVRFAVLSVILLITKEYIFYLALDIIVTLVSNIHITYIVKKRYKYIDDVTPVGLDKEEKNNILKYMRAGIFNRVGQTVVTSTDSIIISAFISTKLVGIYSNYNLIFTMLDTTIYMIFKNITAAVGHFVVENDSNESEKLFKRISALNYWIVSVISVCIICLSTPFIELWLGSEFCLSELTLLIITLNFYVTAMCNSIGNYIGAMGELSFFNRYRALVEAVINLVASVLLVKYTDLGITSVFLGTTLCFVCGRLWMDPYIVYKHLFKKSSALYFRVYFLRFVFVVAISVVCKKVTGYIFVALGTTVLTWIASAIVCICFTVACMYVMFRKTGEYKYFKDMVKSVLKGMLNLKLSK